MDPKSLSSEHVQACRDIGLDEQAIMDAILVGVNFTMATKNSDVFAYEVPDEKAKEEHIRILFKKSFLNRLLFD